MHTSRRQPPSVFGRVASVALFGLLLGSGHSFGFDAQQFTPGVDPYTYFSVVSSRTAPAGRFHVALWYTYAQPTLNIGVGGAPIVTNPGLLGPLLDPILRPITEPVGEGIDPLRPIADPVLCALKSLSDPAVSPALDPLFNCPTADVSALTIVKEVHYGSLVGSYSITDWAEVGIDVPFSWIDSDSEGVDEGIGVDDIRLVGKFQILDALTSGGLGVAVSPFVDIPVGDEDHLTSNGTVDYGLIAITEGVFGRVRTALNVGYRINDEPFSNSDETDEILFGLGFGYLLLGNDPVFAPGSSRLELIGEIFGASAEQQPFEDEFATPVEFLAGARYFHDSGLLVAAAAGRTITDSINGPDWRVVAQAGYTWQPVPPPPPAEPEPVAEVAPPPPPQPKVVVTDEQIVTLEPIFFDFDKATIKPDSYPVLDQVAAVMTDRPEMEVRIEGHTDAIGTEAYNQRLSDARSRSVLAYLSSKGVDEARLTASGFGEGRPIASNDSSEGRAQNRRTEFHIVGHNGNGMHGSTAAAGEDAPG